MDGPIWKRVFGLSLLSVVMVIVLPAQTFTTLVSFNGTDGKQPSYVALVQGADGEMYGTTEFGGNTDFGIVFKLDAGAVLTTLYTFQGANDGAHPFVGLVLGTNGKFYGTTGFGGSYGTSGTIFSTGPGEGLTTLHGFAISDGANPLAPLVQATDGTLYGTTCSGGANRHGTVFQYTPGAILTTLHSFDGTDGGCPQGGLVQASNGYFYGTASDGGANGYGTAFSIGPSGALTTLHSFSILDGVWPQAGLVEATDGNLYGTTEEGGAYGYGTVFEITPAGILTVLHSFVGADGSYPRAPLVRATDGNFYGTTSLGGANGVGTVFEINPAGTLTTIHSFDRTDGANPFGGLCQATDGNFYGTTLGGGARNDGTVFRLSLALGPFLKTVPVAGKVATAVMILGTNLTAATSVTINGTPAAFTVISPALIMTTVPAGASTGKVQVKTPDGTLSSNVAFRVAP
jgi:uncharacterized repeat protein (TIGR03803 family)